MNISSGYLTVAIPVILLVGVHWWLSRRTNPWLGAVVPVLTGLAFAIVLLQRAPALTTSDAVAPVLALGLLAWIWADSRARAPHTAPLADDPLVGR